ncbi:ATP-binding protein [Streptomyces sp. NPDC001595]|uniref:ATP-binding protein n=1 Tax=Streptomyces sp. NPDC001532 TaxID=3154520 RepID=UPI00332A12F7
MSIWWSLHLRREAASVPLARRLLLGTMETAGVDPDISYDLSVALTEACANAVEHGGDHSCEAYQVTAYLDGELCRIEVADSGPGFTRTESRTESRTDLLTGPTAEPPIEPPAEPVTVRMPEAAEAEHGRGLCLIQELADHVHFRNKPGRGGAVVSFDKLLKWRDGAPLVTAS